jgi:transposase
VVQLAQRHLAGLRRRATWKQHGRRAARVTRSGRPASSSSQCRRPRRRATWPPGARVDLEGTYGKQILAAWQAKELLRDLPRLTFKHARALPDRSAIPAALHRFNARIAGHAHLPEPVAPAETVESWWDGIEAYITTGITNAASEGSNRVIKLEARKAYGFRNRANQRLRSHCATARRTRRCLTPHQIRWMARLRCGLGRKVLRPNPGASAAHVEMKGRPWNVITAIPLATLFFRRALDNQMDPR